MTYSQSWWADYRARNRETIRARHKLYMRNWRAARKVKAAKQTKLAREFYYTK